MTIEEGILREPIYATDFGRYSFTPSSGERIIFPYDVHKGNARLLEEEELRTKYPEAYHYLASQKRRLERRKQFKDWYAFSAPRSLVVHERAKLKVPLLADKGLFCALPNDMHLYCPMASGGFSIGIDTECGLSHFFILGLLNSKLMFWRLHSISNLFRGGWITCTKQYVGTLPIRRIDFENKSDRKSHKRIVDLVKQMLSLNKQLAVVKITHGLTALKRQINTTDRKIDQLVYELYNLTDKEIQIVEEAIL